MKTPTMLPLLLLCSALACAPEGPVAATSAGASAGSAAAAPADDGALGPAFLEKCKREVLEALKQGARIELPQDVPVILLTTSEATARRRAYAESLGDKVGYTAAMDSMADLMFAGNLLGRYLPDERVVYVLKDVLLDSAGHDPKRAEEMLFPVLAHELVHAYDHQKYGAVPAPDDLDELLKDPSQLPEIQARMSLLEGRATWASELACKAAGRRPLPSRSVDEALDSSFIRSDGSVTGDALAMVGNGVVRLKLVQYAYGRAFAKRVWDFGGEAFFDQVFTHLPLSMDELQDFDLFLVRWAEEKEAELDAQAESQPDDA